MGHNGGSNLRFEALERALHHWEAGSGPSPAAGYPSPHSAFTIALSREAGARGAEVAHAVGEQLGWPVYDRELLDKIAGEMGLSPHRLESVDENRVAWLLECLESISGQPGVSEAGYVRHLGNVLLSLAAQGECVIVGRGAAHILPPETTLRVRLVAPRESRIGMFQERHTISRAEAAAEIDRIDRQRSAFVKDHFHKDPSDPRLYDLILNSSRFSVPACARIIVGAINQFRESAVSALLSRASC